MYPEYYLLRVANNLKRLFKITKNNSFSSKIKKKKALYFRAATGDYVFIPFRAIYSKKIITYSLSTSTKGINISKCTLKKTSGTNRM